MIPTHWRPCVRTDDGECVGYLVADGDLVVPVTLFGFPLGPAGTAEAGAAVLTEQGLSSLAEPWWLTRGDGAVVEVHILSAYGDGVRVAETTYGFVAPDSPRHDVPIPDTEGLLRRDRP